MMKRVTKKRAIVGALVAGLVATGIGIAAWSTSGSGTGYAKAASSSALTLGDASAATSADLYPGADGSVKIRVGNPNPYPVKVTSVAQQASSTITSSAGAACDNSTGVTFSAQSGLAIAIGASSTETISVPGAVHMSNASDDSCQGATFSIPVTVTAVSNP
jgi:hypothetical protein